ncbi:PREDICTED: uncharacterized protein LOC108535767 [Rhinopithecus bieti]|uniref:uncharacterized protein LOC108535767 n=1 Tax=Rhinopithecus bieti TaxID=61621 RepID=UPI00083BDC59|nr:PREDICTED: uncharacterized protein LOC108535767 [Rhinopithecus bieti]
MESNLSLRVEMRDVGHGTGTRPESADPIECCLSDTGPFPPSKGCHGMQGPLWPWGLGDVGGEPLVIGYIALELEKRQSGASAHASQSPLWNSARGRPADSRELTGTYLRAHTLRRPARQLVTSRRLVPALLAAFDQRALDGVDGHALPSARGRSALELTDPGNPIETPVIMATVPYLIGYLLQFVGSTTLIGCLASQGLYKLDAWKFGSSLPFSYFSLSGISSSSTGDVEMESDLSRCGGATVQAYWLPGDEFIAPAKRDEVLKGFGPIPGKMVRGGGGGVSKRRRRAQESAQTGPNDWPGVSPRSELDQSESCS